VLGLDGKGTEFVSAKHEQKMCSLVAMCCSRKLWAYIETLAKASMRLGPPSYLLEIRDYCTEN
jgi:hypothetical protein